MRTFLVGLVVALLTAAPAHALTLDMPDGNARALYQSWVDSSALPVPDGPIPVTLQNCRPTIMTCVENDGITYPDLSYLANTAVYGQELAQWRVLFLHEVAHVLDQQRGGRGGYRRMFRKMIGAAAVIQGRRGWWSYGFIPDSETFADAYAYCASAPHVMPRDSPYQGYGTYRPTDRQHEVICHSLSVRLATP